MPHTRLLRYLLLLIPLALIVFAAQGQPVLDSSERVPSLEKVPAALPDLSRVPLEQRFAALLARRDVLRPRIIDFDNRCRVYFSNSSDAVECPRIKPQLIAEKAAYIKDTNAFNWDLKQAIAEERNRLAKIIEAMNEAMKLDASAVRNLKLDRREKDFEEYNKLSEEAHRELWKTLTSALIDEGSDRIFKAAMINTTKIDPQVPLQRLERAGLGDSDLANHLRNALSNREKIAANKFAKEMNKLIKTEIKVDQKVNDGEKLDALADVIEYFAPRTLNNFFKLKQAGEVAIWSIYDAIAQSIAVRDVIHLKDVTDAQLRGLKGIKCTFEKHLLRRYEAMVQLDKLGHPEQTYPDAYRNRPNQSASCAA